MWKTKKKRICIHDGPAQPSTGTRGPARGWGSPGTAQQNLAQRWDAPGATDGWWEFSPTSPSETRTHLLIYAAERPIAWASLTETARSLSTSVYALWGLLAGEINIPRACILAHMVGFLVVCRPWGLISPVSWWAFSFPNHPIFFTQSHPCNKHDYQRKFSNNEVYTVPLR